MKILVDDRIALKPDEKIFNAYTPMFNGLPSDGSTWALILQKAYAKFNVNYANLDYNHGTVAFRDLTGKPTLNLVLSS